MWSSAASASTGRYRGGRSGATAWFATCCGGCGEVIETQDISVSCGGVRAVDRVSVTVNDGEIVGLIGPNGSGKTTFLNALTGIVKGVGTLFVDGHQLPQIG